MPRLAVVLLVGLTLAAGCRVVPEPAQTVLVTDDLGRAIAVPRSIDRVVTLAPNVTEIIFAAGAGHKLVGVTTADDYPPAVDSLPRLNAWPVNFETILALKPDLVAASGQVTNPADASVLSSLGLPTYFFEANDLGELIDSIRRAGTLFSTEAASRRAADSLEASLKALESLTAGIEYRPTTLFLAGDETLYSFGQGSHIHDVIRRAGGQSVTETFATRAPVLSDEFVLLARPDVIIAGSGADRLLELHPTWDIVPAIEDGRVFSLDQDLFVRPGPRLIEGTRRLAARLHPDLFPPG